MPLTLYEEERSTATVPFLIVLPMRAVVTVWKMPPDVPVMVMVEAASFEEALAVSVILLVPTVLAGLNEAVTPGGSPETLRLTLDLKLPRRVMVTVAEPLLPLGREMPSAGV